MAENPDLPGPVLAIDLGLARTGLARSDPGRSAAFGLPTFEVKPGRSLKAHLRRLYQEEPFTIVVLGLPRHMDGRPGELVPRVRRLGEWIRTEFGVRVAYADERLTSEEAGELLLEAPRRVRMEKGARDRMAAQLILRDFLAAGCPPRDSG
jgi:putative holliday junction resolvase